MTAVAEFTESDIDAMGEGVTRKLTMVDDPICTGDAGTGTADVEMALDAEDTDGRNGSDPIIVDGRKLGTTLLSMSWAQQLPNMKRSMHMPKGVPSVLIHSQTNMHVPSCPLT